MVSICQKLQKKNFLPSITNYYNNEGLGNPVTWNFNY